MRVKFQTKCGILQEYALLYCMLFLYIDEQAKLACFYSIFALSKHDCMKKNLCEYQNQASSHQLHALPLGYGTNVWKTWMTCRKLFDSQITSPQISKACRGYLKIPLWKKKNSFIIQTRRRILNAGLLLSFTDWLSQF